MPGNLRPGCGFEGSAIGGGGLGEVWLVTVLSWLGLLNPRLSGCHVLRRQGSSDTLETDSRRADHPEVETVGDETRLLPEGEKAPLLEVLIGPGAKTGRPKGMPWGVWKGFTPDGTLSRLPGVRAPAEYMLCDLE